MLISKVALALAILAAPLAALAADDGKGGPLYDTILAQDGKLFAAFNTCDMSTLGTMVADDLQFFHDQDGLSVGRDAFVRSVRNDVCGKFTRSLEPGSTEVWPIPAYGAIEIGVHRFHHSERADLLADAGVVLGGNGDGRPGGAVVGRQDARDEDGSSPVIDESQLEDDKVSPLTSATNVER
jgi:hypothetical protein